MRRHRPPFLWAIVLLFALCFLPALASASIIYVSNPLTNHIEKVSPTGAVSTFVSTGLSGPNGVAFDHSGNLYVANFGSNTISKISPAGAVSVFASTGLSGPSGIAFDAAGNLFVANNGNNTIEKFTPAGVPSLFANTGLNQPTGMAFDTSGHLYVANNGNFTVERFAPDGTPSLFASDGLRLHSPRGLAFDVAGNLFVANASGVFTGQPTIAKIAPNGSVVNFSGSPAAGGLEGLAFDPAGSLYAAQFNNGGAILKYNGFGSSSSYATSSLLNGANFIAMTDDAGNPLSLPIPEPASIVLVVLAVPTLLLRRQRRNF